MIRDIVDNWIAELLAKNNVSLLEQLPLEVLKYEIDQAKGARDNSSIVDDEFGVLCNEKYINILNNVISSTAYRPAMFDAEKAKNDCVAWIREWFDHNGPNCKAIVGISGGTDSSVVAALCVEALGKDRVIGVLMPNGKQDDINYSYDLIRHLGIHCISTNIANIVADFECE